MHIRQKYIQKNNLFPDGRSKSSLYKFNTMSCKTFDEPCPIWATKQTFFFANNSKILDLVSQKTKMPLPNKYRNQSPSLKIRTYREYCGKTKVSNIIESQQAPFIENVTYRSNYNKIEKPDIIQELFAKSNKSKYELPIHIRTIYNRYKKGCFLTKSKKDYNTMDLSNREFKYPQTASSTYKYRSQIISAYSKEQLQSIIKKRSEIFQNQAIKAILENKE